MTDHKLTPDQEKEGLAKLAFQLQADVRKLERDDKQAGHDKLRENEELAAGRPVVNMPYRAIATILAADVRSDKALDPQDTPMAFAAMEFITGGHKPSIHNLAICQVELRRQLRQLSGIDNEKNAVAFAQNHGIDSDKDTFPVTQMAPEAYKNRLAFLEESQPKAPKNAPAAPKKHHQANLG